MPIESTFGPSVRARRQELGLTQDELARRVGCAPITLRKIEHNDLRPSVQIAERLAASLNLPIEERAAFVRLARAQRPASEPVPSPTPSPGPEQIGLEDLSGHAIRGYALGSRLGMGGMGVVYRAIQPGVAREVAVKIILPRYANHPEFIRRFESEAQLIARLEHPHIVPLYDYWREPGAAYLVLRLLRGGSVADLLQQGPLALDVISRTMEQIGTALAAAHRAGIIHRDIKPANILLDELGNAYLADFGLAKDLALPGNPHLTQVDAIVGSPGYLSPEQIRSETVRAQSDIYGLGIVLYELLAGAAPFAGTSPIEIMHQHLVERLPPLARQRPELPPGLDEVIARATAKDPEARFAQVEDFLVSFRQALHQPPAIPVNVLTETDNPFKGLRAFTEADASDFFGREFLVQQLLMRLSDGGDLSRFLAVIGPSGSGKSSVVQAGLLPALRRGALPGSEKWFVIEMLPGSQPIEELAAALLRVAADTDEHLLGQLLADRSGLASAVRRVLPADEAVELVIVIDQFEEVFTLVNDEAVRAHLLDSLVAAVLDERSRVRIIITLRADFIDRPLRYTDFGEMLQRQSEFVLSLTPEELEQAIAQPCQKVGLALEPGLLGAIVHDVSDQPGALPLLQYALTELFERRAGSVLTKEAYDKIGRIRGVLARRAEAVYANLDAPAQAAARQIFLRLVTLGEAVADTRRRVLRAELDALRLPKAERHVVPPAGQPSELGPSQSHTAAELEMVIEAFGHARLITFDRDLGTRGPTVEIAHEALLREWPRLQGWLSQARADVRTQRQLAQAAVEWRDGNYDAGLLLAGTRLEQMALWATHTDLLLTTAEYGLLEASLAERNRQRAVASAQQKHEQSLTRQTAVAQRRAAQRLRILVLVLAAFLLGSSTLTAVALSQRATAQANFVLAEQGRLAAQAESILNSGGSGDLPALLALQSLKYGYTPEADGALLKALSRPFSEIIATGPSVDAIDISPNGRYVVVAAGREPIKLWDRETRAIVQQVDSPFRFVLSVAFSPDGRHVLLTDDYRPEVWRWDLDTGQLAPYLDGHEGTVFSAVYSPDGQQVLSGHRDGRAVLWDATTAEQVQVFDGYDSWVRYAIFTPDGKQVLLSSNNGALRLWDIATGQLVQQFFGHESEVIRAEFTPDGLSLVTGSFDGTVRKWNVATGQQYGQTEAAGEVYDLALSTDGRYIVTVGRGGIAQVWSIILGAEVERYSGHLGNLNTVAIAPDGQAIVTGGQDGTVRWWERAYVVEPHVLLGHTDIVEDVAVSPDGLQLISSGDDYTFRIWNLQNNEVKQYQAYGDWILSVAWSPDGRAVVTAGIDGVLIQRDTSNFGMTWAYHAEQRAEFVDVEFSPDGAHLAVVDSVGQAVHIIDAATGELEQILDGTDAYMTEVIFTSDGQQVITSGDGQQTVVWDLATGHEVRRLSEHSIAVSDMALSPDGRYLLLAGKDKSAHLVNLETGVEIRQFVGHTGEISAVTFSPDGRFVLTGSRDRTARLWDTQTGQEVREFVGHTGTILAVAFALNGQAVVTTGEDFSVRIWQVDLQKNVELACARLHRDFSEEERQLYRIESQKPTCP